MTSGVRLVVVDDDNVGVACSLTVKPGQESFVAPVAISLAEAYVNQDVAWPRLVYDGDTAVGFVMASFDAAEDDYWLWRLNIGADHQGRGYGAFAVREVAREAARRGATRLVTSYVPADGGPAEFYVGLGFVPTGEIEEGEVVMALDLREASLSEP